MKYPVLSLFILFLALPMVLFGQTEEDQLAALIEAPETQGVEQYLLDNADRDDYPEIERLFLNRAKELVLSNEYKSALQILEALLSIDLDNLEVQEIYIAVGKIVREEEAAVPGQAVSAAESQSAEPTAADPEPIEAPGETGETAALTADQIAQAVAKAVTEAMGSDTGGQPDTDQPKGDPGDQRTETDKTSGGAGFSLKDNLNWSLHFGAADLLLYGSQFYTDFYGESQLFGAYGLSLDFEAILTLNRLNLAGEIVFDIFFADLIPLSGTQVSYKVMLGAALPEVIPVPLYARLGFGQLWYLFGDETPNRLITAVPSPLLGVKLNGLKLGRLFSLDSSIDYYLITFFTSYIASAFDISAALEMVLPIKSAFAFTARVEVQPTVMIGSGGAETSAKLKISFGIGNDEN